jgi:hypothetical protein
MDLYVFGTGESLLRYKKEIKSLSDKNTMAFQRFFPMGYKYIGTIPKYWTWLDPYSATEGLEFLLNLEDTHPEYKKFKDIEILIPHFVVDNYAYFRMYMGTTPLKGEKWDRYIESLKAVEERGFKIKVILSTTTKYIKLNPYDEPQLIGKDWLGNNADFRFQSKKCVFGTAEYDSDYVIGEKYKWGLENKLTSAVYPLAHHLGASRVFTAGFDFFGKRLYDYDEDYILPEEIDETGNVRIRRYGAHAAASDTGKQISLGFVTKWKEWHLYHKMEFFSLVEDDLTLLNQVVDYKSFEEIT